MSELCNVVSDVISSAAIDFYLQHTNVAGSEVYKIPSDQIRKYLFLVVSRLSVPVL
jgi:hypothetical protein